MLALGLGWLTWGAVTSSTSWAQDAAAPVDEVVEEGTVEESGEDDPEAPNAAGNDVPQTDDENEVSAVVTTPDEADEGPAADAEPSAESTVTAELPPPEHEDPEPRRAAPWLVAMERTGLQRQTPPLSARQPRTPPMHTASVGQVPSAVHVPAPQATDEAPHELPVAADLSQPTRQKVVALRESSARRTIPPSPDDGAWNWLWLLAATALGCLVPVGMLLSRATRKG